MTERVEEKEKFANFIKPFSHSGHCIGPPSKISILVYEGIMEKISYERRAYESVDDKSLS